MLFQLHQKKVLEKLWVFLAQRQARGKLPKLHSHNRKLHFTFEVNDFGNVYGLLLPYQIDVNFMYGVCKYKYVPECWWGIALHVTCQNCCFVLFY